MSFYYEEDVDRDAERLEKARDKGWSAGYHRQYVSVPYPKGSDEAEAWESGYHDGEASRDEDDEEDDRINGRDMFSGPYASWPYS